MNTQDNYTGYNADSIVLKCPNCGTYPVTWIKQHSRTNEGGQERYTCEVCDNGKE